MRRRTAVTVVGAAAVLGTLTGGVVLPDRDGAAGDGPSPARTSPVVATPASTSRTPAVEPSGSGEPRTSASPATVTPNAGAGSEPAPVSSANLLTTADFAAVGLTLEPRDAGGRLELVVCDQRQTLDVVAESGPPVQQRWERGRVLADEQAITARDEEEARAVATRVLQILAGCQERTPGQWVYGPTHTRRLGPAVTAGWLGTVDGTLNTGGRAPKGEKVNGGVAVLRHGAHVAVLSLAFCASAGDSPACVVAGGDAYEQLASLSRTAALRLG